MKKINNIKQELPKSKSVKGEFFEVGIVYIGDKYYDKATREIITDAELKMIDSRRLAALKNTISNNFVFTNPEKLVAEAQLLEVLTKTANSLNHPGEYSKVHYIKYCELERKIDGMHNLPKVSATAEASTAK